jgi:hypothetical protein
MKVAWIRQDAGRYRKKKLNYCKHYGFPYNDSPANTLIDELDGGMQCHAFSVGKLT